MSCSCHPVVAVCALPHRDVAQKWIYSKTQDIHCNLVTIFFNIKKIEINIII